MYEHFWIHLQLLFWFFPDIVYGTLVILVRDPKPSFNHFNIRYEWVYTVER